MILKKDTTKILKPFWQKKDTEKLKGVVADTLKTSLKLRLDFT